MLDYFKKTKAIEIKALRHLSEKGGLPRTYGGRRRSLSERLRRLSAALKGPAVIAEYKRASPSRGDIALGVTPEKAAADYGRAGAAALSVLTEKSRFKGRLNFIGRAFRGGADEFGLPILRKDFIFDPLQVAATAATPASALLLIVKLTPDVNLLRSLMAAAAEFGLECVVEVLDEGDLELARKAGASLIQVNARDFSDLSVDLSRAMALARRYAADDPSEVWIAASGFSRPEELRAAGEAGFAAVLAGTALMAGGDLAASLARLSRLAV